MNSVDAALLPVRSSDERFGAQDPVSRGQDLAQQAVDELIDEMARRAAGHQLDRGVRLSFPYFDDRRLSLRWRDFTVIPRGRILFVPAFVVIAVEREIERVRKDRQYSEPTRLHLVDLLERLRAAFAVPSLGRRG
jgi:hypothetical protein